MDCRVQLGEIMVSWCGHFWVPRGIDFHLPILPVARAIATCLVYPYVGG